LRTATAASFPAVLRFLGVASRADPQFRLPAEWWHALATHLRPPGYLALLSLIAGRASIALEAPFLVTRPCFLSLMFVVVGDLPPIDRFVRFCRELAQLSKFNLRQLHEGDVDAIFLSSVINDGVAVYRGTSFPVRVSRGRCCRCSGLSLQRLPITRSPGTPSRRLRRRATAS
jgi:hypothetical protein